MAKRKKGRKASRRRRIGAAGGNMFADALTVIGGAVLGGVVKRFVPGSETVKSAVITAAGVFTPSLIKGPLGMKLGAGMTAYGGISLVKELVDKDGKFIAGVADTLSIPMKVGEISDNLSVIAGDKSVMAGDPLSVLAGLELESEY